MEQLLRNFKNFLAAGDEARQYLLCRDDVEMLVNELERIRSDPVYREVLRPPVYRDPSFADIKRQARRG